MADIVHHDIEGWQFLWPSALCGFVAFHACIGIDLAKKIYRSLVEDEGFGSVTDPKIAGAGLTLNYVLQLMVVLTGGGYAAGIITSSTGGEYGLIRSWNRTLMSSAVSVNDNAAITATNVAIWLWSKIFADSPLLSRCLSSLISWAFGG
jgi:hypothetical protein